MPDNNEQAILEAASRVFETAAFLSVYPLDPSQELPPPERAATMTFHGAANGRVSMRVALSVLDSVVDNLLDLQDDPDELATRRGDVLKEMLNMLCGNILTGYFGAEPVFDLSPPELLQDETMPQPTSKEVLLVAMNIENTLAEVMFEVQNRQNR